MRLTVLAALALAGCASQPPCTPNAGSFFVTYTQDWNRGCGTAAPAPTVTVYDLPIAACGADGGACPAGAPLCTDVLDACPSDLAGAECSAPVPNVWDADGNGASGVVLYKRGDCQAQYRMRWRRN